MTRGQLIHKRWQEKVIAQLSTDSVKYFAEQSYFKGSAIGINLYGSSRADLGQGLETKPNFLIELKTGANSLYMPQGQANRYIRNAPEGTPIYLISVF